MDTMSAARERFLKSYEELGKEALKPAPEVTKFLNAGACDGFEAGWKAGYNQGLVDATRKETSAPEESRVPPHYR